MKLARLHEGVVAEVMSISDNAKDKNDVVAHYRNVLGFEIVPASVVVGSRKVANGFAPPTPATPVDPALVLMAAKREAASRIDMKAESLRRVLITPGDGQLATYLAQEAEAKIILSYLPASAVPSGIATPYLSALVGIMGATLLEVAQVVAQMSIEWNAMNAAINAARLKGKAAVEAAGNASAVEQAEAGVDWPVVGA